MRLVVLPGVFRPLSDSRLLCRALGRTPLQPGAPSLDLCTGSGLVAVTAALGGATATAVDVSRRAVLCTRLNARLNGVCVEALRGDLMEPVADRRFALITGNPPYVPSDRAALPHRGPRRGWEAGPDGRAVLDRICRAAPHHLEPGGRVLLVHSDLVGTERTLELLGEGGLDAEVLVRERGPLGPLMRARAERLPSGGGGPGADRTEELVVICGRRPA